MALKEAIKSLIEAKGLDILKSPMSLNILSDYNAFSEYPSSKNILRNIISEGYLDKLSFFYKNQLPIGDAPRAYVMELYQKLGFRKDVSLYVINSLISALGYNSIKMSTNDNNWEYNKSNSANIPNSDDSKDHISFYGIPLSKKREEIALELQKKGYAIIEKNSKLVALQGEYIGIDDVVIRLFGRPNDIVADVSVNIDNTYFSLYKINEEHIISLLTEKYGEPSESIRNYYDCEEFDGILLFKNIDENKPEALDYKWIVKGGYIQVTSILGSIRIDFIDEINKEITQRESNQRNLDSL